MNTSALPAVLMALAVAGCAGSSGPASARGPYVKPGLIMLTADQAAQRGIAVRAAPPAAGAPAPDLQPLDASAVSVPADIKVYTLNRAADPSDRDILHEEHVIYRRETAPRWRLDAPVGQKILVGPRVTDGRGELQPLMNKELATYLADQRRATEANGKAIAALFQAVEALNRQQQALARRDATASPAAGPVASNPIDSSLPRPGDAE